VEDVDLAGDGGLFADALDLVQRGHVQLDGVAGGGDAVVFALDFGEGGLEAVLWVSVRGESCMLYYRTTYPLRLEFAPALCDGDGVAEDSIILPKLQFSKRGPASKEVQHGRHESLLLAAELNTSGGLDGALELELASLGGRHSVLLLCGRRSAAVTGCEITCCGL